MKCLAFALCFLLCAPYSLGATVTSRTIRYYSPGGYYTGRADVGSRMTRYYNAGGSYAGRVDYSRGISRYYNSHGGYVGSSRGPSSSYRGR